MNAKEFLQKEILVKLPKAAAIISIMIIAVSLATYNITKKSELRNKKLSIREQCKEDAETFTNQSYNYLSNKTPITKGTYLLKTECKDLYTPQVEDLEKRVLRAFETENQSLAKIELLKKELETQKNVEKRIKIFLDQYFIEKLKK